MKGLGNCLHHKIKKISGLKENMKILSKFTCLQSSYCSHLIGIRPSMIKEAKDKGGSNKKSLPEVVQGFKRGCAVTEATKVSCIFGSDGTNAAGIVNFADCGVHQNVMNGYKLLGDDSINTGNATG